MGAILNKLRGGRKNNNEAQQAISQLKEAKGQRRVELENTPFFFFSKPFQRSGAVVVLAPKSLRDAIKDGGMVRIRVKKEERKDLRMEVSSARYGGSGKMSTHVDTITLICKIPGAEIVETKRSSDRLHTAQYNDLLLEMPEFMSPYRIVNLGTSGLKLKISEEGEAERFPIGKSMDKGMIRMGQKASVELVGLVPRSHHEEGVGMEMKVKPEGHSGRILQMFLESLENKIREIYRVETTPAASTA